MQPTIYIPSDPQVPANETQAPPHRDAVDWLLVAERKLLALISNISEETTVQVLAKVIANLENARVLIERPMSSDKPSPARVRDQIATVMVRADGTKVKVAVNDVSLGGASIECEATTSVGQAVSLVVPELEEPVAALVVGRDNAQVHLSFEQLPSKDARALMNRFERHFLGRIA